MTERKQTKKYVFSVEGGTEKWYLEWLQNQINAQPSSIYNVKIKADVERSPAKYAKNINPLSVEYLAHICDCESPSEEDVNKFERILGEIKEANERSGLEYGLFYSNYTFELWMILHKADFFGYLVDKEKYLEPLNKYFKERFAGLKSYKEEANFKRCLNKLTLDDVKAAIRRAETIEAMNMKKGEKEKEAHGMHYYGCAPSLTIHRPIKMILSDCGLLP